MEEKLLDIFSIINLLEADMEQQKADEIHLRIVKVIHRLMGEVIKQGQGM